VKAGMIAMNKEEWRNSRRSRMEIPYQEKIQQDPNFLTSQIGCMIQNFGDSLLKHDSCVLFEHLSEDEIL
jgi:hypothetical protein